GVVLPQNWSAQRSTKPLTVSVLPTSEGLRKTEMTAWISPIWSGGDVSVLKKCPRNSASVTVCDGLLLQATASAWLTMTVNDVSVIAVGLANSRAKVSPLAAKSSVVVA